MIVLANICGFNLVQEDLSSTSLTLTDRRLDYCNVLHIKQPLKAAGGVQLVQYIATCTQVGESHYSHITSLLLVFQ